MFGNAGVFAWFSYIKPFMLNVSGFAESKMMLIMMLAGLGMVVGNLFSSKIFRALQPAAHCGHDRRGHCRDAAADLCLR
ncbi:MFS transport protein AraJ [Klebsiella pneumoniae]|nr:MFS transport protein AraJ [Klebsiella pneumoniae]